MDEYFNKIREKHWKGLSMLSCIKTHEEFIADESNGPYLAHIAKLGKELCLANACFMCETCKSCGKLSFHHLILRNAKNSMEFGEYLKKRHWFENIKLLCWFCHMKEHGVVITKEQEERRSDISDKMVLRVKNKYFRNI